jgi:dTDP-4-dehydrorhamnose reductase
MRIMLTGANGQVGWELSRSLMPLGEVIALTRSQCDLSRPETIPGIVQEINPDVIVNAAAYTAVDKAEEEEGLATTINGTSVGVIAEEARKLNALLIHYSTDYVFDGKKTEPYTEEDIPNPINAYGRSKLAGEEAVRKVGGKHLIFRTSWVYAARGHNFIKTMLHLARERDELKVVADQFGAPTSAELIADVTALVLYRISNISTKIEQASDTYHLVAEGETNWHGYAQLILETAKNNGQDLRVSHEQTIPITTSDYPLPAKRPVNSRLDTRKLCSLFEVVLPSWHKHVERAVLEMKMK